MARVPTPGRPTARTLAKRPLWTCPKCGAKLVGRNMWHACGDYSVEKFLEGKGPVARSLFGRLVDLIRICGPFEYAPAKTRVAFMVRVRFAAVTRFERARDDGRLRSLPQA
jgi:hypothetical protein